MVLLEIKEIMRYRISDLNSITLLGLSGDPHSLMINWAENSVVVAIGVVVMENRYEELIESDFLLRLNQFV